MQDGGQQERVQPARLSGPASYGGGFQQGPQRPFVYTGTPVYQQGYQPGFVSHPSYVHNPTGQWMSPPMMYMG